MRLNTITLWHFHAVAGAVHLIIPRDVEQAFSKRRQAIEEAARTHGYTTAKGMELAAIRTRRPKAEAKLETLRGLWREEAKDLGCKIACNIDPLRGHFASNSDPF